MRFVLNLAKHYSVREGRGGEGEIHINWHLSEDPAPVKHVGILNGGERRDSERKSGEEGRRRWRRRRRKKRGKFVELH